MLKAQNLLLNTIRDWIQPNDDITDPTQRHQIRLINAIVLVFVPLAIFAGITHLILAPSDNPFLDQDPTFTVILLSTILLSIAALLGRFVGYWGATALVFLTGYFIIMVNATFDQPDYFDATYIILLSVLAAALYDVRLVVLIGALEVLSVNLLLEHASLDILVNLTIFLIVSNLIIIFTTSYRSVIETERRQKLAESDAFLRLITQQLPVSVWITDSRLGRRATFGRSHQIDNLDTIPNNAAFQAYQRALTGDSAQFETVNNDRVFQYHIEPMRDEQGTIIGTLGVATDITEQKMAQQLEIERERVQILSQFIEYSSHDLRTPISNINTYLYLLDQAVKTDKEHNYIDIIRQQSTRLHDLISNMLLLQRLELQTHQECVEISLKTLLDGIIVFYHERIQSRRIQFDYHVPEGHIILNANEQHLHLAIAKLLDNAIQFTAENGHITLSVTQADGSVTISVQDTGSGIPEDQLPHIFELFYRGDDSRPTSTGDNGLGLSIVERIVRSHNGEISVDSMIGEGTTFHIKLPVVSLAKIF